MALLTAKTIQQAAADAGIGERTLRRWLTSDDAFQAAYSSARRIVFSTGIARLQGLTELAVGTLQDLLDLSVPPAVRLGAARFILEMGLHERDAEMIVHRLDEVQRALEERSRE